MVLYILAVVILPILIPAEKGTALRAVITIVPVLPMIWVLISVVRHLKRIDERDKTTTLQSMSVGFGASMLAAVTVGFLGFAGFDGIFLPWIVFIIGMMAWLVASVVLNARANR
ncbi:hypothetical protein G7067_08565 [Leucobacter insecticola]|uniref:Uncharacterized protein n=1 Tax=Leucobacter insecticola TaxID=2714934 RepID=A0A6G8FJK0_9MICO|nr:hypothetical protein [Leucobacter insecticola]QIM16459.1 hypothetical protein G7067_08565 [Leucobacter insecticola]